jgi:hypothetical protein
LICIRHRVLLLKSIVCIICCRNIFVHILYRTSQAEARDLLENYQQIQASL